MKYFILTKRQLTFAVCVTLLMALTLVGTLSVFAGSERKIPIYSVDRNDKKIAISFDAAWGA